MLRLTHPYPPLTDGTVWLRAPREADAPAVHAACQDPEIKRWTGVPDPYALEDAQGFIARSLERTREGSGVDLYAVDRASTLLGTFGVPALDRGTATAEIGYWVAREARGRGIAARAVVLLRDWLVEAQGFRTVELLIHRDNLPSRRVAEKAGFPDTGERRPQPRRPDAPPERSFIVYAWTATTSPPTAAGSTSTRSTAT